jgi:ketol-acid reductoisomerase
MARIWQGGEVDVGALEGRRIAVIGYGNQGRAQALNLRDRGFAVLVGGIQDASAERAREDGFDVQPIRVATERADVVLFLIPDEVQPEVFDADLRPALRQGHTLSFASGYNVTYGFVDPPEDVDVILVAPRMIGQALRERVLRGLGAPILAGVERDASGDAWAVALAAAAAIGGDLPEGCIVESSAREETLLDLASEHTWAAALPFLLRACCLALIDAGASPEAAILETYASGELGEIGRAMAEEGLFGQLPFHSHTSQYGQLTFGPRYLDESWPELLREAVDGIRDGSFAREWDAERRSGLPRFRSLLGEAAADPLVAHEARLFERLGRTQGALGV